MVNINDQIRLLYYYIAEAGYLIGPLWCSGLPHYRPDPQVVDLNREHDHSHIISHQPSAGCDH